MIDYQRETYKLASDVLRLKNNLDEHCETLMKKEVFSSEDIKHIMEMKNVVDTANLCYKNLVVVYNELGRIDWKHK